MKIHLDECIENHRLKSWERMPFLEATEGGSIYAEFCPDVEYMRDELFPDELVWVER